MTSVMKVVIVTSSYGHSGLLEGLLLHLLFIIYPRVMLGTVLLCSVTIGNIMLFLCGTATFNET